MRQFWKYANNMNLFAWILGVLVFHVLLYVLLGTDNWLGTAFLATSVWAVGLFALKMLARRMVEDREKDVL